MNHLYYNTHATFKEITKTEENDHSGSDTTPKKNSKSHRSPELKSEKKYEQRSRFQTVVSSPAVFLKEKNA